jgi:hypothetical protein
MPEPNLFRASFCSLLAAAREHGPGEVTLFGEMVAVLWERGSRVAALRLEGLGNKILKEIPSNSHPKRLLQRDADEWRVCALHTDVTRASIHPTPQ